MSLVLQSLFKAFKSKHYSNMDDYRENGEAVEVEWLLAPTCLTLAVKCGDGWSLESLSG